MIDFSKGRKYIIGLVHLLPLPGRPFTGRIPCRKTSARP